MDSGCFMAFSRVAPVGDEKVTIGPDADFHAPKERILRHEKVFIVMSDVTGSLGFDGLLVHPFAVHVECEQAVVKTCGPMAAGINGHADVCMSASEMIGLAISAFRPSSSGIEVVVVGDGVESLINGRIHAFAK